MTQKEKSITDYWQDETRERIHDPVKAAHMAVVQDKWREFAQQTDAVAGQQAELADIGPRALEFMAASVENSRMAQDVVTSFGPRQVERAAAQYDRGLPDNHFDSPYLPPAVPSVDPKENSK